MDAAYPWVADNESTAVEWFELDTLPEPLLEPSQTRLARAMV